MPRDLIYLVCQDCKRKNYTANKNKRTHPERVEYKKYCRFCGKHTKHKESK